MMLYRVSVQKGNRIEDVLVVLEPPLTSDVASNVAGSAIHSLDNIVSVVHVMPHNVSNADELETFLRMLSRQGWH